MALRPYKFVVQAVVQEVDADGNVVNELPVGGANGEPSVIYGCGNLAEWAESFPDQLEAAEQAQAPAAAPSEPNRAQRRSKKTT